jgi:hypothetical protein
MKQLKVIKSTFNTAQTTIINASFNESITLEPNSRIWLDKLSMTILNGNTSGITIPQQVIQLSTNSTSDDQNIPFRNIIIPAGTYSTIQSLIDTMNNQINASLNSNPIQFTNSLVSDIGLAVLVSEDPTTKKVTIAYQGVDVETQADAVPTDCILTPAGSTTDSYFEPESTTEAYSVVYQTPLLQGALQVLFKLQTPVDVEQNYVEFGLYLNIDNDDPALFTIKLEDGVWYWGNFDVYTPFDDQTIFDNTTSTDPNTYYCFYIDPNDIGHLRFGVFDVDSKTTYGTTPLGAFNGFEFTSGYHYQIRGDQNGSAEPVLVSQPYMTYPLPTTISVDDNGTYVNHTGYIPKQYISNQQITLGAYPDIPQEASERTMNFIFNSAQTLANGLGILSLGFSYSGYVNTYTGTGIIGFVNFFDMALDVLNIPIQNYISSDSQTGRVNTLAYFTPQRLDNDNVNVFIFENKNLTFLDIMNKEKMNVESLQFRLYNVVDPNSIFNIQGLSFNVFIDSPSDGRLVRID